MASAMETVSASAPVEKVEKEGMEADVKMPPAGAFDTAALASLAPGLCASAALTDGSTAHADIPLVDMSAWFSGTKEGREKVAAALKSAAETWGFFYLTGHSVPTDVIEGAEKASAAFFAQPEATKKEIDYSAYEGKVFPATSRGYVSLLGEALDPTAKPDMKEFVDMGPHREEVTRPFSGPNLWPAGTADWVSGSMEAHMTATTACARELVAALAVSLGLPTTHFDTDIQDPMIIMRYLHYPPTKAEDANDELTISCGKHTDYGIITLLYQREYGLQVRHPHTGAWLWIPPPPVPHAFTVNLGDCMQRYTRGRYQSTQHRVVNVSGRERYSMALFFDPDFNAVVRPITGDDSNAGSVSEANSDSGADETLNYAPLTAGELKLAKYSAVWQASDPSAEKIAVDKQADAYGLFKS